MFVEDVQMMMKMLSLLLFVHICAAAAIRTNTHAAAVNAQPWKTLSGNAPLVIARGGFSGLFPQASQYAYQFAITNSVKDVVLLCDLQLTKEGAGICISELKLDNTTTISNIFPQGRKTYTVDGKPLQGWFSSDFTSDQLLNNVTLIQNIFSRPSIFDGSLSMSLVEDVVGLKPAYFWINAEHPKFFTERKLDMMAFILDVLTQVPIDFISSPDMGFLQGLSAKLGAGKTKLVFRFLEADAIEPTTKQSYGALLKDLHKIKTFASGILVPKAYIWPVDKSMYLEAHTTLVADAHALGLEVYASKFANDMPTSYNYSSDPTMEYLQFVDNPDFSVDGVFTDFPSTASEAISCLAHTKKNEMPKKGRPMLMTHNGASGSFAGCTDLAYQKAVEDGAEVIDCSVQLSKDGVAFCLNTANLMGDTNAVSVFMSKGTTVPEIQKQTGIFSFDLTWSEIQTLKPEIASPSAESGLLRNPAAKNKGTLMTLDDFLKFAKNKTLTGILINIQNAAYLASKKGLAVIDIITAALTTAGYDKQTTQQVFIQSDDTSVLSAFKKNTNYKRVLRIPETISDMEKMTVAEIKQFADAVNLQRSSLIENKGFFVTGFTDVITKMHDANILVFVSTIRNEFTMMAYDYFSDPFVELATYVLVVGVDGIITEFPATTAAYFKSPCSNLKARLPYTIMPAKPNNLMSIVVPGVLPPVGAPAPVLAASDVLDAPLPPVAKNVSQGAPVVAAPTNSTPSSGQTRTVANVALCALLAAVAFISASST